MRIEIGLTEKQVNTQYAPLAALLAYYRQEQVLAPLEQVPIAFKRYDFSAADKLGQVLVSILAGCGTLSEVTPKLKGENALAAVNGWPHFSDQSNLSRLLDELSLKQIGVLRAAATAIWRSRSQAVAHDWRGYLWLDYDLSGLPCSPHAEASQKGYFSEKKRQRSAVGSCQRHSLSGNSLVQPLSRQPTYQSSLATERRRGRSCFRLIPGTAPTHGLAH